QTVCGLKTRYSLWLIPISMSMEMLVVEELYKEAVLNTERKMIIFNGELDRIRSGCILQYRTSCLIDYLERSS
uniref:DUF1995 domain-containing protein n=1 Tax=Aegilops tauschii subsp. strangulata TaxID=200361 RepID=A0A453N5F2_AEGTS